jgi:hypothetical protein
MSLFFELPQRRSLHNLMIYVVTHIEHPRCRPHGGNNALVLDNIADLLRDGLVVVAGLFDVEFGSNIL